MRRHLKVASKRRSTISLSVLREHGDSDAILEGAGRLCDRAPARVSSLEDSVRPARAIESLLGPAVNTETMRSFPVRPFPGVQLVVVSSDATLCFERSAFTACSALGAREGGQGPEQVIPGLELDGEAGRKDKIFSKIQDTERFTANAPDNPEDADEGDLNNTNIAQAEDPTLRFENVVKDRPEAEIPDVELFEAGSSVAIDAQNEGSRTDERGREDGKRVMRAWVKTEDKGDGREAWKRRVPVQVSRGKRMSGAKAERTGKEHPATPKDVDEPTLAKGENPPSHTPTADKSQPVARPTGDEDGDRPGERPDDEANKYENPAHRRRRWIFRDGDAKVDGKYECDKGSSVEVKEEERRPG